MRYPGVVGRVHLNAVHPLSLYGPADEHGSAFGEPAYPVAHALFLNFTAKLGAFSVSVSMAYPGVDGRVHMTSTKHASPHV